MDRLRAGTRVVLLEIGVFNCRRSVEDWVPAGIGGGSSCFAQDALGALTEDAVGLGDASYEWNFGCWGFV